MKNFASFFTAAVLLGVPVALQAQLSETAVAQAKEASRRGAMGSNVSAVLQTQLQDSYVKARQAQENWVPRFTTPGPLEGEKIEPGAFPAREISPLLHFKNPSDVYPDAPFLKTDKQVTLYFLAKSNLALEGELRHLMNHMREITFYMPNFRQQVQKCQQPRDQVAWLAQHIDPKTDYLFVGDMPGYPETKYSLARLLQALRLRFLEREIILLTEYITDHISADEVRAAALLQPTAQEQESVLKAYESVVRTRLSDDVWDTLQNRRIGVVGLEPTFVQENATAQILGQAPGNEGKKILAMQSDEGLRLRHLYWKNRIAAYRAQHPKALFVVYGEAPHFNYFRSDAMSKKYEGANVQVVNLFPRKQYILDAQGNPVLSADYIGWFAEVTQNAFPQDTLYFTDPWAAQLAGFDFQIKVPPMAKEYQAPPPIAVLYPSK